MNYIITLDDGRIFGGWNPIDGQMILLSPERKNLAYRMQRTLAMRTLSKVQGFSNTGCKVEMVTV